jgi:hypothetical protein
MMGVAKEDNGGAHALREGLERLIGEVENKLQPSSQSANLSQTGISR